MIETERSTWAGAQFQPPPHDQLQRMSQYRSWVTVMRKQYHNHFRKSAGRNRENPVRHVRPRVVSADWRGSTFRKLWLDEYNSLCYSKSSFATGLHVDFIKSADELLLPPSENSIFIILIDKQGHTVRWIGNSALTQPPCCFLIYLPVLSSTLLQEHWGSRLSVRVLVLLGGQKKRVLADYRILW